jgi:SRSO17 transposase
MADEMVEERFSVYVRGLAGALGHADRKGPFDAYCRGLILPGERKSVEPMAARVRPLEVSAAHQSLHHLVAKAAWSDVALLAAVREQVLPAIGPVEAWIVDDTGFPKKGKHSVGVARQYCGQLGKQDNCQVAVSLSVANGRASLPVAYQLYLPQAWTADPERRRKAGVPEEITFATKPQIALEQIREALTRGVPAGVVLADAGYGADMGFQEGLLDLSLSYLVGVQPHASVWASGTTPLPAKPWAGRGRPPTRRRRADGHRPMAAKTLALSLPAAAWQTVTWRDGVTGDLISRFAAVRVRPGHRDYDRAVAWPELWLLSEWPEGEAEPTKLWFANLAVDTALERLVALAKLRWRIERDYQELKQELGLGHFEGRGWRGFHHHASLCIAAYGFLVRERAALPPTSVPTPPELQKPVLPETFRPRGSKLASPAPRPNLDRHPALPPRRPARPTARALPMLRATAQRATNFSHFMTQ